VELYAAGRDAVDEMMTFVGGLGLGYERGRALDFGCGVGHTAQALARHFEQVDGLDSSVSMVELADTYNEHDGHCRYRMHRLPHLGIYAERTFDFVYADGSLPNVRPDNQLRFISEFHRVLRPNGVAVFDTVTGFSSSMRRAAGRIGGRSSRGQQATASDGTTLNFLRAAEVRLHVELVGARVAAERRIGGPDRSVERRQFVVQRIG
jgi:cyclopropane fatty-acyl-phospholipid synthase-like methyltransferase